MFFVDEKHVPELNFSCSYEFYTFVVCSEDTFFCLSLGILMLSWLRV